MKFLIEILGFFSAKLCFTVLYYYCHHHHHHVPEGLGMLACSLILKMKLVPLSLPPSSYVSSSVWFILQCLFWQSVSILCTCCSHFSWYCFISCTMFYYYCINLIIIITSDVLTTCFDLCRSSSGYSKRKDFFGGFCVLFLLFHYPTCYVVVLCCW